MSFIKASGLGPLTASNTATIVDPATPVNGSATLSPLVSFAAKASTSGTSIDFTGIPSWAKRITVMFQGVSTNGQSLFLIQLGTSGGIQTSGYISIQSYLGTGATYGSSITGGFGVYNDGTGNYKDGSATISLLDSSDGTWVAQGVFVQGSTSAAQGYSMVCTGSKTLSGTLDRVRITTTNGTDTFDAGKINVMYE